MRINLQKFTLSTLTFSLATTLAVGGFSESANAQQRGGGALYDKSNVVPALRFEAFLETEDGDDILDAQESNKNIGIFPGAIQLDQVNINPDASLETREGEELFDLRDKAELFGDFNEETGIFNLSATRLEDDLIQYQIYKNDDNDIDNIENPDLGIRFAPIEAPSSDSNLDFVNNIENIIGSSNNGEYGVEDNNSDFNQDGAGVLGLAINKSIRFIDEDTKEFDGSFGDLPDTLNIELNFSQPSTSIPEPTTTLASVFALGFAGKFLRKSKKSNA